MLKHYILITLQTLTREKVYALINILGLSLALACTIILGLYIRSELSYDRHNLNHQQITRVVSEITTNDQSISIAVTSPALGPLVARNYAHLQDYVRFVPFSANTVLSTDTIQFDWDTLYYADNSIFDIFTHKAIYGDLHNALTDPSSIVISESMSRAYWGDANSIGKTLELNGELYQVTAVFEDLPENTHMQYDALLSFDILLQAFGRTNDTLTPGNLLVSMAYTYFKLPETVDQQEFEQTLNAFYIDIAEDPGQDIGMHITYRVQPLADVHFDDGWTYGLPTGNSFYLYGFSAVALFILLVACINYTNLAIARATKRAREIGVRKVMGAEKKQLLGQFIGESLLYTMVAFCLSLLLVVVLERFTSLPALMGKQPLLDLLQDPSLAIYLALLAVGIGIVCGLYPAFYLSSLSPVAALSATRQSRSAKFSLREFLVLVQFFVSIAVVSCTILMALQMHYIASKALGFDKDNRIIVDFRGADSAVPLSVIRNELLQNPNILGVAESSWVPGASTGWNAVRLESNAGQMEDGSLWVMDVSETFIEVMGMEIAQGRDFAQGQLHDAGTAVIVNEALVEQMNWQDPLGKHIIIVADDQELRVVGVVRDFHFASLRQSVEPVALQLYPPPVLSDSSDVANEAASQLNVIDRAFIVQLSGENNTETISFIKSVINQFTSDYIFEFTYFADALDALYMSDENLMALTGIFSVVCIFISSMGLYGLSAFNTELRTKEIGVRKVLGASTRSIIILLAQGQLLLIGVAAVLASIVSYLAINNWLSAYANRADIAYWVFIVAALFVAVVAFTTMALQSYKTARSSPVKALRYE